MLSKNIVVKHLIIFFVIGFFSQSTKSQNWDVDLLRNINGHPPTSKLWKGASLTAEPVSVSIPVALFTFGLFKDKKALQEQSLEVVEGLAATTIITEGLKIIVNRQRPYEKFSGIYPYQFEKGQSFPSGHAAVSFSVATSLTILYKKWYIVAPAYLWAVGVSYSRLYLGEHYPSDIMAAAFVGSISTWLSHKAYYWLRSRKSSKKFKL